MKRWSGIGIIVVCVGLATLITFARHQKNSSGPESLAHGEMVWIKCAILNCGARWQIGKREYFRYMEENARAMTPPPLPCIECGKNSGYRAEKCTKCGEVFFRRGGSNDFPDRCPQCGYSELEQRKKKAAP